MQPGSLTCAGLPWRLSLCVICCGLFRYGLKYSHEGCSRLFGCFKTGDRKGQTEWPSCAAAGSKNKPRPHAAVGGDHSASAAPNDGSDGGHVAPDYLAGGDGYGDHDGAHQLPQHSVFSLTAAADFELRVMIISSNISCFNGEQSLLFCFIKCIQFNCEQNRLVDQGRGS